MKAIYIYIYIYVCVCIIAYICLFCWMKINKSSPFSRYQKGLFYFSPGDYIYIYIYIYIYAHTHRVIDVYVSVYNQKIVLGNFSICL